MSRRDFLDQDIRKARSRAAKHARGECENCPSPTREGKRLCGSCASKNDEQTVLRRQIGIPAGVARELGFQRRRRTYADR